MAKINLKLDSIDKVKTFVNTISLYEGDFDLASNRYVVDAKSIMGIFSLDLANPLELNIHDDSLEADIKAKLAAFII